VFALRTGKSRRLAPAGRKGRAKGKNGGDPVSYILSVNVERRMLNAGQKATPCRAGGRGLRLRVSGADEAEAQG
jgi:hypothetical protein